MLIYILFYTVVTIVFFGSFKLKRTTGKLFSAFLFLILLLFAGLRGNVGSDTFSYVLIFQLAGSLDGILLLLKGIEPGYLFLNAMLRVISDSNFLFIFAYSLFQVFILFLIFRKIRNKLFILVYIWLFYLSFHFNTLRAGTAALLFVYTLLHHKKESVSLYSFLAPLFHVSVLAFYPIFVIRMRVLYIVFTFLILFIIYFILPEAFSLYFSKASGYSDYMANVETGVSLYSFVLIIYLLVSLFMLKDKTYEYKAANILLIVCYAVSGFIPIFYRFIIFSQVVYFYYLLDGMNEKLVTRNKVLFFWPLLALLFAINLYGIYNEKQRLKVRVDSNELTDRVYDGTYIPYVFYWNDYKIKNVN